jgi:hypothetical protein
MWVSVGDVLAAGLTGVPASYCDPPYESPIEDAFAWHLIKHLDPAVQLTKQVTAPTICGSFRLDFLAQTGTRRIGFECDGAEYHDELRDECRDAMIVWSGHADVIYRLRGADLHHRMNEVLGTLPDHEPALFRDRGRRNVAPRSGPPALRLRDDPHRLRTRGRRAALLPAPHPVSHPWSTFPPGLRGVRLEPRRRRSRPSDRRVPPQ